MIAQKAKIKLSPKNPDIEYLYTEFLLISANLIFKLVFHLHIYMQGSSHVKYPNHKIFNQDNMPLVFRYCILPLFWWWLNQRLTLLWLEEILELFAFVLHRLLLTVWSDLLDGKVCHVHLHEVQHLKNLPGNETKNLSSKFNSYWLVNMPNICNSPDFIKFKIYLLLPFV